MNLGDLRQYLANQTPDKFSWVQKYHSILSIVRGLAHLHAYNPPIVYGDLKSSNVLLDSAKGTKLNNIGKSCGSDETGVKTKLSGSYQWMAPEVISGSTYSSHADIYSFGIILSEFCTHQLPYFGDRSSKNGKLLTPHQIISKVREGGLLQSFDGENVPAWVKDVAAQCLQLNEYDRPSAIESLMNIVSLDVTSAKASSRVGVVNLTVIWCMNSVSPSQISWPPQLTSFYELHFIFNFPELLFDRDIQHSEPDDLTDLPGKVGYLYCYSVRLSNITIDKNTAIALNALDEWGRNDKNRVGLAFNDNVTTDPIKCSAIGGVIQQLFKDKTTYKITACVLGMSTTIPITSIPNKGIEIFVGAAVGAVFLNHHYSRAPSTRNNEVGGMLALPPNAPEHKATLTKAPRSARSRKGSRGLISVNQNIPQLDIEYLLNHRLVVTGAYGEVWVGSYGAQQIAIKRLNTRQPKQVQKFIDEIILMSQLESDYIVKFIGASLARPVDIECVVEFMNLGDLRNYLVINSPNYLVYLHTYNPPIIHRDLKSRNVLLDSVKGTKLTYF
ncbi:kinase, partial [Thraustotheca clavata]